VWGPLLLGFSDQLDHAGELAVAGGFVCAHGKRAFTTDRAREDGIFGLFVE
jgi:hypothetical protein